MELEIVGAGLGRTGTNSLKVALEQLLGGPCYHMYEVAAHPADAARWHAAVRGERVDWDALLAGYLAVLALFCFGFFGVLAFLSTRDTSGSGPTRRS